jgi:hypothetical protein
MNAKDKLKAAMNQKSTTQLSSTERTSLNSLEKPSVVQSKPEKTGQKTIRAPKSLLKKLEACSLALTVKRNETMRPLDVTTEMLELYINKVEKELGHELNIS